MQVVQIEKGQVLNIKATQSGGVTTIFQVSYDELLEMLKGRQTKGPKRKYARSEIGKFVRDVNLYTKAIETGRWSTGYAVDTAKLTEKFDALIEVFPDHLISQLPRSCRDKLNRYLGREL